MKGSKTSVAHARAPPDAEVITTRFIARRNIERKETTMSVDVIVRGVTMRMIVGSMTSRDIRISEEAA